MDSLLLTCDDFHINKEIANALLMAIGELSKKITTNEPSNFFKVIMVPVISATLGAFSAFIFNRLNWSMQNKIANTTKSCEGIIEIIDTLESESLEYWSQRRGYKNDTEFQLKERKLIYGLSLLKKHIDILVNMQTSKPWYKFWKANVLFNQGRVLSDFHSEIYDEITGGLFQSKCRDKDLNKAFNISKKCMEAKSTLSEIIYLYH
ncbi:hypothetical protein [Tolumonas auensis]|uniref:hypothetical protein n=1 Tax=Tolumonas auensis TaxID=43948 RepID=UPI002AA7A9AA|nr:hypothetical protein [Tolumonas auensis]